MVGAYFFGPIVSILRHIVLAHLGEDLFSESREDVEKSLAVFLLLQFYGDH